MVSCEYRCNHHPTSLGCMSIMVVNIVVVIVVVAAAATAAATVVSALTVVVSADCFNRKYR